MGADMGTPLITWESFVSGAYADLARQYTDPGGQAELLLEATRACEGFCERRLAAFTLTDSLRAEGIDPDEYADSSNLPMDIQSTIGASYAMSLGANSLVRTVWLTEYAPRYPDMWSYSDVSVSIVRSYGGSEDLTPTQVLSGPDPSSGRLWFQLGLFLPVGSMVYPTYSGGYQTVPADLARACKHMVAAIIVDELDPAVHTSEHDPEALRGKAETILLAYGRS